MIEQYYISCVKRRFTESLNDRQTVVKTAVDTVIKGILGSVRDEDIIVGNKTTIESKIKFFSSHYDFKQGDQIIYNNRVYEVYGEPKNTINKNHHCRVLVRRVQGKNE